MRQRPRPVAAELKPLEAVQAARAWQTCVPETGTAAAVISNADLNPPEPPSPWNARRRQPGEPPDGGRSTVEQRLNVNRPLVDPPPGSGPTAAEVAQWRATAGAPAGEAASASVVAAVEAAVASMADEMRGTINALHDKMDEIASRQAHALASPLWKLHGVLAVLLVLQLLLARRMRNSAARQEAGGQLVVLLLVLVLQPWHRRFSRRPAVRKEE